jgi:alpha-tubulin suppressor-like RCC1 family protein
VGVWGKKKANEPRGEKRAARTNSRVRLFALLPPSGDIGLGRRMSARNKQTSKLVPQLVRFIRPGGNKALSPMVRVFAGGHSSFALDARGTAWAWGPCNYGQLGIAAGESREDASTPPAIVHARPVLGLPPLREVACAAHHALFLTTDGRVFAVGRNDDGRLGLGDKLARVTVPTEVPVVFESADDVVVHVACGEAHSLFTTRAGHVYACGYGDLMQLGLGHDRDVYVPTRIASVQNVQRAHGGAQHSVLLGRLAPPLPIAVAESAPVAPSAAAAAVAAFAFLPPSGWECQTCLLSNDASLTACCACESVRG